MNISGHVTSYGQAFSRFRVKHPRPWSHSKSCGLTFRNFFLVQKTPVSGYPNPSVRKTIRSIRSEYSGQCLKSSGAQPELRAQRKLKRRQRQRGSVRGGPCADEHKYVAVWLSNQKYVHESLVLHFFTSHFAAARCCCCCCCCFAASYTTMGAAMGATSYPAPMRGSGEHQA